MNAYAQERQPSPDTQPDMAAVQVEYQAGYEAAGKGDLDGAEQHFQAAVKLAPGLAEAHNAFGSILLAKGEAAAAASEFEKALAIKPLRSAQENLALAYAQSGDTARALAQFARASAEQPLSPGAALVYAPMLVAANRTDDAVAMLRQSVTGLPPDIALADPASRGQAAELHDALGAVLARKKQWTDAQAEFAAAIHLDDRSGAHYRLGALLLATGQPEQAAAELATAEQISPDDLQAALLHVRALNTLGNGDEALAAAHHAQQIAAKTKPDAATSVELEYQLALATQNTNSPGDAIPLFRKVVDARPNDPAALSNLALALVQTGKAKEAIPFYDRSLKLDPSDPTVLQGLGVAYLQQNNTEDAEQTFRKAVALAPSSAEIHYDLGLALKLKDSLSAATTELKRSMELDPTLLDPHITLGTLYMQQGKFDEAAAEMRLVLAQQPQNGNMWATLGSTLKQAGRNEEAIVALRHAIELQPEQPGSHTTLAGILQAEGKTEEAAAERKTAGSLTRNAMDKQAALFATNAGDMLLGKGDVDGAIAQYRTATKDDSGYAPAHRQLALALEQKGLKTDAAEERRLAGDSRPQP